LKTVRSKLLGLTLKKWKFRSGGNSYM